MTDLALVERCRQGEEAAFALLFERYQLQAWRLAFAITGDRALADDAAQDAFVQAFRSLKNLRPDGQFRPWFLAIVANRARRLAVRRQWWRWLPLGDAALLPNRSESVAVEQRLDLWAAVRRLPVDLRTAVALRYVMDLGESDMADILSVPPGTVKSRLHRARQLLQKALGEDGMEGEFPWPSQTK